MPQTTEKSNPEIGLRSRFPDLTRWDREATARERARAEQAAREAEQTTPERGKARRVGADTAATAETAPERGTLQAQPENAGRIEETVAATPEVNEELLSSAQAMHDAYAGISRTYTNGRGEAQFTEDIRALVQEREGMGNSSGGMPGVRYAADEAAEGIRAQIRNSLDIIRQMVFGCFDHLSLCRYCGYGLAARHFERLKIYRIPSRKARFWYH